jgi:hypothetical protein
MVLQKCRQAWNGELYHCVFEGIFECMHIASKRSSSCCKLVQDTAEAPYIDFIRESRFFFDEFGGTIT